MTISREEMAALVAAWDAGADATNDPKVRQMINAEIARVHRAFELLPIGVTFVEHDPYKNFEHMRDQVLSNKHMLVWKGASDTPLWDPKTNWMFRAVHDWDHITKCFDFSMEGEAEAFRTTAACNPALSPLYLSEIMLQAAIQNYTGSFVPQKLVIPSESVQKKALRMRGLRGTKKVDAADLVWLTAGLLELDSPMAALLHLQAQGLSFSEALVVLDAARDVNASVDEVVAA